MPRLSRILITALAGACATLGTARAGTAATAVSLRVPGTSFTAGRTVLATLVNPTGSPLQPGFCATLAREVDHRWVAVTHTHGVDIACPHTDSVSGQEVAAHGHETLPVELYDDLEPGAYRVSLSYRVAPRQHLEPPLRADSPTAGATFTVTPFAPGPPPHLSQGRLAAIAVRAARADGDPHPKLIQYAEASRQMADLVASGDLVDEWNWSYLIAERGRFVTPTISTPPGIPTGPGPVRLTRSVITIVVDARTGRMTDGGISNRYPDMARLGRVTTLHGG